MTAVARFDVEHARKLTERIRMTAVSVSEKIDRLKELVNEAKESEAHLALGYSSWTAYLADVLGETPMRLERDVRQELVAELSEQGMSTRAIAPIVGASVGTVHADRQVFSSEHLDSETSIDYSTGEVSDDFMHGRLAQAEENGDVVKLTGEGPVSSPRAVTGLDGKQYTKPTPKPERRKSIVDDAYKARTDLWQAIERIRTLTADDRFNKNKADILAALQPSADLAIEVLQDLFTPNEEK